jgi:hypothetical protein
VRSVLRMRHYCDFCKKSTGTRNSMEKHEGSCTANPARVCRMCKYAELCQQPMEMLIKTYAEQGWKAMHALAEGCPACILAADRLANVAALEGRPEADDWQKWNALDDRGGWEFRSASKDFLAEHAPERDYGAY